MNGKNATLLNSARALFGGFLSAQLLIFSHQVAADISAPAVAPLSPRAGGYCRLSSDRSRQLLSCKLADARRDRVRPRQPVEAVRTRKGVEFMDINDDGNSDFCRCLGQGSEGYYACNLAAGEGFGEQLYTLAVSQVICAVPFSGDRLSPKP